MSLDTVLGGVSLLAAGADWYVSRARGKRSWWPFWLLLAVGFAAFSVWSPFGKARP